MSATTEQEHRPRTPGELEAELESIRAELEARQRRGGMVQLAAIFSTLIALAALLAVAFKVQDNNNAAMTMHGRMAGMNGGVTAPSAGPAEAGPARSVQADLGDFWVRPNVTSVAAGEVTLSARNLGTVEHELMVERMPLQMDGPGQPNEEAAQGMIEDLEPGASGRMTLRLTPGMYVLFCNIPGHYAAGQHTMLRVTR
jgi:uncharacterized cupredoxin-like copper-binding protein